MSCRKECRDRGHSQLHESLLSAHCIRNNPSWGGPHARKSLSECGEVKGSGGGKRKK